MPDLGWSTSSRAEHSDHVYCASGEHCTSAVQVLRDLRYLNVGSLIGGLQGWLEAGGLVESSGGRNSGSSRQIRPIWARSDW